MLDAGLRGASAEMRMVELLPTPGHVKGPGLMAVWLLQVEITVEILHVDGGSIRVTETYAQKLI